MMKLWLARHGEAVDANLASSDFDRVLTVTGRRRLSELASWLMDREETPDLFLHSPLVRARQTAETLAGAFGADPTSIRVENRLAPGIDTDALLASLASTSAERILCVCHQPDVSRCLSELIGGGRISYFPGTIAGIEFTGPIIRSGGHLRWLVDPHWFA